MAQQYARDQPAGSSNHIKNIAIVGATGSVGEYITKSLLEGGKHVVTAITRKDSKSTMPNGVKEAKVDYEDDPTLVDALKCQDALIITMKAGVNGPQEKLIEAAAKAKVPWVMPNEYTADVESKTTMPRVDWIHILSRVKPTLTADAGQWTWTNCLVSRTAGRKARRQRMDRSGLLFLV